MSWAPLRLSLGVALCASVLAGSAGIAIAFALAQRRSRGGDLLDALSTAPLVLPPTVLGYYVLVMLGRSSLLGHAFEQLTGRPIVFTRTGAVIAAAVGSMPLVIKAARAAFEGVDPTLVRAARTLGARRLRVFLTIQLPLAHRGILAGLMLTFARALGDFGVTLMVAGDIPGETQTAALAIYDAIQSRRELEALGMILVLSTFAVLALYAVNRLTAPRDA
jgi:molybdate transport system permease protein